MSGHRGGDDGAAMRNGRWSPRARYAGLSSSTAQTLVAGFVVLLFLVHLWVGAHFYWQVAALGALAIATPYIVVALRGGGHVRTEVLVAGAVVGLVVVGLLISPVFIVASLVGHGIWDAFKHWRHSGTPIFGWYPPVCAAIDIGYPLLLIVFAPSWTI